MAELIETKDAIFEELLKRYEGAAKSREFQNAVRFNEYGRELGIIDKNVEAYRKRYERAQ